MTEKPCTKPNESCPLTPTAWLEGKPVAVVCRRCGAHADNRDNPKGNGARY